MKKIYFIGIGGIGMSALARYYNGRGWKVFGYDMTETKLTKKLVEEGIEIHYVDDPDILEKEVEFVVYTPAVPPSHQELSWYRNQGYQILKRAEVLGMISEGTDTIAIAGTHGKTTTSSMLSHILRYNKYDFTGFVGGISVELESNFIEGQSDWVLLEADEYDRSFLQLTPMIASVMSVDADHLDIYGDHGGMIEGFKLFTYRIRSGGRLFVKNDDVSTLGDDWLDKMREHEVEVVTFGDNAEVNLSNVKAKNGVQFFDYRYKNWSKKGIALLMAGNHNVENASVAMSIALELGLEEKEVYEAIVAFKGVKRRFEYIIRRKDFVMIDDYAHHPTELRAVIAAVKGLYPNKRVLGVFQPHLYSRTQDFYLEFAKALDGLDETVLMDIYPARELPIEGVTTEIILNEMKSIDKSIVNKEELLNFLKKRSYDVLLILGAGDIGVMVEDIASMFKK